MDEIHPIPEDADTVLFAEDLVGYFMKQIAAVEVKPRRAEQYRNFIYNAFNETTIKAIENLEITELLDDDFDELVTEHNNLNKTRYDKYAKDLYDFLFPMGFNPRHILPYSAQIALMAVLFSIHGILDVEKLAISNIISAFKRFDAKTDGWNNFKEHAERYATMAQGHQAEREMDEINAIPHNPGKLSFAEDFVYYVIFLNYNVKIPPWRVEKYRKTMYNLFTGATKEAIDYLNITREIIREDVLTLAHKHKFVNIDIYKTYAKSTYNYYFFKQYDAKNFLPFCTHLARLAAYFYKNGVPKASKLAISSIEYICDVFDMIPGGWDEIKKYEKRYANMDSENQVKNSVDQSDDDSDENVLDKDQNSGTQNAEKLLQTRQKPVMERGSSNSKTSKEKIQKKYKTCIDGLQNISLTSPQVVSSQDFEGKMLTCS